MFENRSTSEILLPFVFMAILVYFVQHPSEETDSGAADYHPEYAWTRDITVGWKRRLMLIMAPFVTTTWTRKDS